MPDVEGLENIKAQVLALDLEPGQKVLMSVDRFSFDSPNQLHRLLDILKVEFPDNVFLCMVGTQVEFYKEVEDRKWQLIGDTYHGDA